jgi:hypothetical protein
MADELTYDIACSIGAEMLQDDNDWSHLECQDELIQTMAEAMSADILEQFKQVVAEEESKKIEMKINPNKTSTTATMEQKLATLKKELETYLALFHKAPPTMMDKTAFIIDSNEWGRSRFTGNEIFEYIRTHTKVDGEEWCCGSFGSRWADTVINGKLVRLAFTSRKSCPEAFQMEMIPQEKLYQILVDVQGDAEDKKAKKYKKSADEYTEVRKKAVKHSNGCTITNNAEMRKLMKTIVGGRRKSRGETCFYWHRERQEAMWATNEDIQDQVKLWKKQMKDGDELQFLESNCQTKLVNGEEWHILVCGHKTKDFGIDPLGMGIDDGIFVVSGLIYWFRHKDSRDALVAYLNK